MHVNTAKLQRLKQMLIFENTCSCIVYDLYTILFLFFVIPVYATNITYILLLIDCFIFRMNNSCKIRMTNFARVDSTSSDMIFSDSKTHARTSNQRTLSWEDLEHVNAFPHVIFVYVTWWLLTFTSNIPYYLNTTLVHILIEWRILKSLW